MRREEGRLVVVAGVVVVGLVLMERTRRVATRTQQVAAKNARRGRRRWAASAIVVGLRSRAGREKNSRSVGVRLPTERPTVESREQREMRANQLTLARGVYFLILFLNGLIYWLAAFLKALLTSLTRSD